MKKVYGTTDNEYNNVIALINKIFRTNRGFKPTMMKEFPNLLSKNNMDNMRIIKKGNIPISVANFLKQRILLEGASLNVASIGAVCTDPLWRGKSLSSLILDDIENNLYIDEIELLFVSGTRALYQRRGCTMTKNFLEYTIYPENIPLNFEFREYTDSYMHEIFCLYNTLSTRFYRSYENFMDLMISSTIPWGNIHYKKYVIFNNNKVSGYIVLKVLKGDVDLGEVKECFIEDAYIFAILKHLAYINHLQSVSYKVNKSTPVSILTPHSNIMVKDAYQEGSLKVVNFEKLMTSLLPYFSNHVDDAIVNQIKFQTSLYEPNNNDSIPKILDSSSTTLPPPTTEPICTEYIKNNILPDYNQGFKFGISDDLLNHVEIIDSGKTYKFILDDEVLEIRNIRTLNKLIFEGSTGLHLNLTGKDNLKLFIDTVFPIPFVYLGNLNYQ
ncbi:MAG: GNAT family N-acetyltransferase [Clostridium sp.]